MRIYSNSKIYGRWFLCPFYITDVCILYRRVDGYVTHLIVNCLTANTHHRVMFCRTFLDGPHMSHIIPERLSFFSETHWEGQHDFTHVNFQFAIGILLPSYTITQSTRWILCALGQLHMRNMVLAPPHLKKTLFKCACVCDTRKLNYFFFLCLVKVARYFK